MNKQTNPGRHSRSLPVLARIYRSLLAAYGGQHWWPADTRFEMIVGAYLTQNTSWRNVEKALRNLRRIGALNVERVRQMPLADLEACVRPAGYFRQKAARLKVFTDFLCARYQGSLSKMFAQPTGTLRTQLLTLKGIGPETADSILLYAGGHPVFVIDSYTRRLLVRHRLHPTALTASYDELRDLVESSFRPSGSANLTQTFKEFHALIVQVGKKHCGKVPDCAQCPLQWHMVRADPGAGESSNLRAHG